MYPLVADSHRDACGTGFVAESSGVASRRVVTLALAALRRLLHRGAKAADDETGEEQQSMELEVAVEKRGACQRHLTISVSRSDIDRYLNKEFSELVHSAEVPGFRPGHAPRKLIETRFRKDVSDRVKGSLLMDAIEQECSELPASQIMRVRYDALVRNPVGTLQEVCAFGDLEPTSRFLSRVKRYPVSDMDEKWKTQLSPGAQELLGTTIGAHLERYGFCR